MARPNQVLGEEGEAAFRSAFEVATDPAHILLECILRDPATYRHHAKYLANAHRHRDQLKDDPSFVRSRAFWEARAGSLPAAVEFIRAAARIADLRKKAERSA